MIVVYYVKSIWKISYHFSSGTVIFEQLNYIAWIIFCNTFMVIYQSVAFLIGPDSCRENGYKRQQYLD